MSRFCSYCGAELEDNVRFCPRCGTPARGYIYPNLQNQGTFPAAGMQEPQGDCKDLPSRFDDGIKEMFFVSTGRLNRLRYFLRGLVVFGVSMVALIMIAAAVNKENLFLGLLGFAIFGLTAASGIMLSIRRCHDFGKSGYFWLTQFIPFIGAFMGLYILLKGGDKGPNQYGPDPLERRQR